MSIVQETVELYANFYKAVTSGDATRVTEFIQKGLDINYDFKVQLFFR